MKTYTWEELTRQDNVGLVFQLEREADQDDAYFIGIGGWVLYVCKSHNTYGTAFEDLWHDAKFVLTDKTFTWSVS